NSSIRFTVEGILLPKINDKIYGWECMPYKTSHILIILDVFVYKSKVLLDKPYRERRKFISKICEISPEDFITETPIKEDNQQLLYTNGFVFRSLETNEILKIKNSYNYVLNSQTL